MQIPKHSLPLTLQSPQQNHFLAALPPGVYERLLPQLELVSLPFGLVLHESNDAQKNVYFPIDCIVSLIYLTNDGSTTQVAVVGSEGLIGASVVFSTGGNAPSRAVVTSGGKGYRLSAKALEVEFKRGGGLQRELLRFTQARITLTAQNVGCNRYHTIEQQLCRWLLLSLDRLPTNKLAMTQELIANMMGVRRESVTEAAGNLKAAGAVKLGRGNITVLDRLKLEEKVCECYKAVKNEYDRLLPRTTQWSIDPDRSTLLPPPILPVPVQSFGEIPTSASGASRPKLEMESRSTG